MVQLIIKQIIKYVFDEIMNSSINKIEKLYETFKDYISLRQEYEIKQNINNLKKVYETGYNNKILKELNKKHIVEKT